MKNDQKICCSVASCKHNCNCKECDLEEIMVCPCEGVDTGKADESECSSYEKRG